MLLLKEIYRNTNLILVILCTVPINPPRMFSKKCANCFREIQLVFKLQLGERTKVVSRDRLKPHAGQAPPAAAEPPRRGRAPRRVNQIFLKTSEDLRGVVLRLRLQEIYRNTNLIQVILCINPPSMFSQKCTNCLREIQLVYLQPSQIRYIYSLYITYGSYK